MRPVRYSNLVALAAIVSGQPLPTEFRIFSVGWNDATNPAAGPERVLFDARAAAAVMAVYAKHGVDVAIDLEHDSTSAEARVFRSDAADARGYCQLEVRAGELWAVGVDWSEDGEQRLRAKKQKYISPYFNIDKDGRVVELISLALVAQPATDHASPIVAARSSKMDPKLIGEALDALISGDTEKCADILKALVATAAGGETPPAGGEAPPGDALGGAEAVPPEKPAAQAAAMATAAGEIAALRKAQSALESQLKSLREERDGRELAERRVLVADLVRLSAETPATAWADKDKAIPCARLMAEPLAGLKDRVSALRVVNPARHDPTPPSSGDAELTPVARAALAKMTPEQQVAYRKTLADRNAARRSN